MSGGRPRLVRAPVVGLALALAGCANPTPAPTPSPTSAVSIVQTPPAPSAITTATPALVRPSASSTASPTATATAVSTPEATATAAALEWTRIVAHDIRWSGDSQHFTVPTATGTDIRDRQFNVVQTVNHLREADWLDDSHVVGYLSETENVLPAKKSGATAEVVTLGNVGSVTTNMPIGFGPFASRHGAAVVRVPTDPRSYNDHFVVWSADGSVSKDQDGWTSEWSRDGSKLVVEIQRSPFNGATKVLTWPAMTSLYASDEEHESAGGAKLDPTGRYLAVWTSLFRGYVTGPWLHIVDFETGHDSEVLFERSDTGQFTFWTADTHISVDDGKQVQVFDTIGQLVETYEPPLAIEGDDVPIPTASADGSSIAFISEYTPRDIALIRDGVTSFIVPPVTGELGNYASFSPDGSVLIVQPGGDSGSLYLANIQGLAVDQPS